MTIVTLNYTCKNGTQIEMTSNDFSNQLEALKWKNWLNYLLNKLQDVDNVERFGTSIQLPTTTTTPPPTSTPTSPSTPTLRRSSRLKNKRKVTIVVPATSTSSNKFSDMDFHKYGKGYFLCPNKNHVDYGRPYYHNGWWMTNKYGEEGWFFKAKYLNNLLEKGVTLC